MEVAELKWNKPFSKNRLIAENLTNCALEEKVKVSTITKLLLGGVLIFMTINGCTGKRPDNIGVSDNHLTACPDKPNCVSSDATDEEHQIAPFQLKGDAASKWPQVVESVRAGTRVNIVTSTDTYLHAEYTSLIFRFVDDLELLLNLSTGVVSIRSSSRLGTSDLGANRKRVEALREVLKSKGLTSK